MLLFLKVAPRIGAMLNYVQIFLFSKKEHTEVHFGKAVKAIFLEDVQFHWSQRLRRIYFSLIEEHSVDFPTPAKESYQNIPDSSFIDVTYKQFLHKTKSVTIIVTSKFITNFKPHNFIQN